ncbi:MAG: transcription termination factor NusA [Chloroflexi bacterium]|nr:transcription termination factor NusA [Chloroflexota bacterium]
MLAITQLAAEKNLPKEVVLGAVETALVSAYRKTNFEQGQKVLAHINPLNGSVSFEAEKEVVLEVSDVRVQVSLAEAKKIEPNAKIGDIVMVESTPKNVGRIAAQTAKQVILQRLHEAENAAVQNEFAGKIGDIISGVIQRVEQKQVILDLGRAEAMMPASEQVASERYRAGMRLRVFLLEVGKAMKGPQLVVSRSHPGLLKRLFELEVPEVYNGTVEIRSVAREAGSRSKVAVMAKQHGIDPVGCCVGLRGIRIQNIVNELNGEKIDVVAYNSDPAAFIVAALSPAQVVRVELNHAVQAAIAVIPDKQLSLAIGKEGQNVRLAVRLTGWKIDIKSVTEAGAETPKVIILEKELPSITSPEEDLCAINIDKLLPITKSIIDEEAEIAELRALGLLGEEPVILEEQEEEHDEEEEVSFEMFSELEAFRAENDASVLRFAEDIMPTGYGSGKKKKKKSGGKRRGGEGYGDEY